MPILRWTNIFSRGHSANSANNPAGNYLISGVCSLLISACSGSVQSVDKARADSHCDITDNRAFELQATKLNIISQISSLVHDS